METRPATGTASPGASASTSALYDWLRRDPLRYGHPLRRQATLWPNKEDRGTSTVVRARIDEKTRREAAAVLDAIGLTVSDAFRLMMVRIAAEKRLPFEPLVPNPKTVAAMEAARRGELVTVGDVDGLMADLHAED